MLSRLSLRTRLLVGVIVLAGLGLIAADVATYRALSSYLLGQVDDTLNQVHVPIEHGVFEDLSLKGPLPPEPGYCLELQRLGGPKLGSACFPVPGTAPLPEPRWPEHAIVRQLVRPADDSAKWRILRGQGAMQGA